MASLSTRVSSLGKSSSYAPPFPFRSFKVSHNLVFQVAMQEAAALGARVILGDRKSNVDSLTYPSALSQSDGCALGNDREDLGIVHFAVADANDEPGEEH